MNGWSFVSGGSAAFTRLGALEGQKGIFKLAQAGPGKVFLKFVGSEVSGSLVIGDVLKCFVD